MNFTDRLVERYTNLAFHLASRFGSCDRRWFRWREGYRFGLDSDYNIG